ncbi:MAG: HAMP domain-containing histidine kinase, partial [Bacteroidales bacterium]|nr:HAMP domain-containing histidine kinase [Bacteroidales bacterium]
MKKIKIPTIGGICGIFIFFVAASLLLYKVSEQSRKKAIIISRMESYAAMVEQISEPAALTSFIPSDIRVTIIETNGEVIFDSYDNNLTNHAGRPEIIDAQAKGKGVSVRESETSSLPYIYFAKKGSDGRIIRVAQLFEVDLKNFLRTDWPLLASIFALALVAMMGIYIFIDKAKNREHERAEQEKRRLKHEMTGNISHELKTPVASIQGYLEILVNHPDCAPEKRKLYTDRAFAQSLRLSDLIRDIAIVTKMEEAPDMFPKEKLFLRAAVDQAIDEMSEEIAAHNMTCINNLAEGCEVNANGQLLHAIFRNLLENSIKYAGDGSVIVIDGTPASGVVYRDNGKGVAEADLPYIFDRFWRGSAARSNVSGSGLGLSIVRNAALLHGATIKAFTPEPHGLG